MSALPSHLELVQGVVLPKPVGAHPVHGSIATVTLSGVSPEERTAIEQHVNERLSPFVLRHEIAWR